MRTDHYAAYINRPGAFAREVLKVTFTPSQERVADALLTPPYRVLVPSANSQGKTLASAALVLWWFATRSPAVIRTTAPTLEGVRDLLWKEIRTLASNGRLSLPFSPRACRIERAPNDYATGTAATSATRFHGHHGPNQLFVFEEATDIDAEIFTATESMFAPPGHAWLVIFNPTTTSARVYVEYSAVESSLRKQQSARWAVVRMSALDHPNIDAELRGEPPPVPSAMRVGEFERLLISWSQLSSADPFKPVGEKGGPEPGDVIWPPLWTAKPNAAKLPVYQSNGQKDDQEATLPLDNVAQSKTNEQDAKLHLAPSPVAPTLPIPRVYKPGPEAQARLLARFPDQSATGVWGDGDWLAACRELPGLAPMHLPSGNVPAEAHLLMVPEVGADIGRFGDDPTELHTRHGSVSLSHESAAKRPTDQTAGRIIELCRELADWYNARKDAPVATLDPKRIPIKVDDSGVGGGVSDLLIAQGYNVVRVNSAETAIESEKYPNVRSELWFVTAERARRGELDFSRLDVDTRDELRRQALTATWKMDASGRRCVMPKDEMKALLGRSPDGCFVAGTQILTSAGNRPIETMKIGDSVWTRDGWRPVVNAGMTSENAETLTIAFSNGSTLTGTPNHPVFTEENGWIRLDELSKIHTINLCHNQEILSSSAASLLSVFRKAKASHRVSIFTRSLTVAGSRASDLCIKPCGLLRMARFLRAMRFTTKTSIRSTTTSAISNVSRLLSMGSGTRDNARKRSGRTSTESVISRRPGTHRRKVWLGILSTRSKRTGAESLSSSSAKNANVILRASPCKPQMIDSAVRRAPSGGITITRHFLRKLLALGARNFSCLRHRKRICAAPVHALRIVAGPVVPVYNLTVSGSHEYYANGILVHNCDALNLAYFSRGSEGQGVSVTTTRTNPVGLGVFG